MYTLSIRKMTINTCISKIFQLINCMYKLTKHLNRDRSVVIFSLTILPRWQNINQSLKSNVAPLF